MAAAIGGSMRELGIHQGLAPVLDVIRDPRWGRVDECIAEDPYVVGTLGTAYVRGLQGAGRARHPQALRRLLRLARGPQPRPRARPAPRELADVLLPPFEMAVRDGGRAQRHELLRRDRRHARRRDPRLPPEPAARASGASTAWWSRTTSRSRSCTTMHRVAADRAPTRPRSRSRPASTSSCPAPTRISTLAALVRGGGAGCCARRPRGRPRADAEGGARAAGRRRSTTPPETIDLDTPEHRAHRTASSPRSRSCC